METIISDPVAVQKVERIRSPIISISNPFQEVGVHPLAEISFGSEKLQLLDGVVNAALPAPPVIRRVIAVMAETVTVTDPATQQTITISTLGLAESFAAFYCKWYKADRQAEADRAAAAAARIAAEAEAARIAAEAEAARIAAEAAAVEPKG
jgi:hypothetical protein